MSGFPDMEADAIIAITKVPVRSLPESTMSLEHPLIILPVYQDLVHVKIGVQDACPNLCMLGRCLPGQVNPTGPT